MIVTLEPVWSEAVQRRVYRALLLAAGFPGETQDLAGLLNGNTAIMAVLATLLDGSVTWADGDNVVCEADRRMLGARLVPENEADFVVARGGRAPRTEFRPRLGELLSPEQAATVVLSGGSLRAERHGVKIEVNGPGVQGTERLRLSGFDPRWFEQHAIWNQAFPLGVDMILADGSRIAALPRSTRVRVCAT